MVGGYHRHTTVVRNELEAASVDEGLEDISFADSSAQSYEMATKANPLRQQMS
jgi:hypothetical protein